MRRRSLALLLTLCLLTTPALAAWSDLSETHWAYADLTQAAVQGILNGYPDGTVRPESVLTQGEYLTMLARVFYPQGYDPQDRDPASHWALPAYDAALLAETVLAGDYLPIGPATLDGPMTRRDAAILADRVLTEVRGLAPVDDTAVALTDLDALTELYRQGVAQCAARGLIVGYPDGSFRGGDTLTRAAGATILLRLTEAAYPPGADWDDEPMAEPPPPTAAVDAAHLVLGETLAKKLRLFGDETIRRYPSKEVAEANMQTVTVPVWRLDKGTGTKTPSEATFQINAVLATQITAIFTEIYNDPEQFPIYGVGGYAWRGDSSNSEHNCGTALDINYMENYQVLSDGRVAAGSHWTPGEDPHSIPPNGSVVRIFKSHGFSWGGDAWDSNQDYMHFSYLGK